MISSSSSHTLDARVLFPPSMELVVVGSVGHWWVDSERKEEWFNAERVIGFA